MVTALLKIFVLIFSVLGLLAQVKGWNSVHSLSWNITAVLLWFVVIRLERQMRKE
jgi:hypothetical protein